MNEELRFRRARPDDAARIMEIIRQAQAQMRALGSLQWQDGYPAAADIDRDIACGYGWVFEKPDAPHDAETRGTDGTGIPAGNPEAACAHGKTGDKEPAKAAGATGISGTDETTGAPEKASPSERTAAPGSVVAYGAVVFDGEPAYDAIEGTWLTPGDYVVLHRLAVADGEKGRGVAKEFMQRVEALARARGTGSFRVDTNYDNRYMLRTLERLGFAYCGKVYYRSGERLAFEKPFGA